MKWDTLHWYIGPGCNANPRCVYCFEPYQEFNEIPLDKQPQFQSAKNLNKIALKLKELKIKKIILGGGEPLLADGLPKVIETLKNGGAYVGVHTNGIALYHNQEKIDWLKASVDDIAIPIDSLDDKVKKRLRHYDTILVFKDAFARLLDTKNTKVGIHTVATTANLRSIPQLYYEIKRKDFDYWKIYEFNGSLALNRLLCSGMLHSIEGYNEYLDRFSEIRALAGLTENDPRWSITRSSKFGEAVLGLEKVLRTDEDSRIKVILMDDSPGYIFLDNAGEVHNYPLDSADSLAFRARIGNIFSDKFEDIISAAKEGKQIKPKDNLRSMIGLRT
jgi:molybdenum cofactor biosynthesis enzyme MoaA